MILFCFKQKTAYEMRSSDWSSDVCSSDLLLLMLFAVHLHLLPVSGRAGFTSEVPPITHLLLIDTLLHGRLDAFGDALAHIILPAITLGLPMASILMREIGRAHV